MTGRGWWWAAALLVAGLAASAALWWLGVPALLLPLVLPVAWRVLPRRRGVTCSRCGRRARRGDAFCPRDGTPLARGA